MKIEYTCEACGTHYSTQKAANDCEESHKAARKREDLKAKSEATISDLIERHVKTFNDVPALTLSNEATNIVAHIASRSFAHTLLSHLQQVFGIYNNQEEKQ